MKYKSFRIKNFKGIQDTTIHIEGVAGASVFSFVGLNESGKTTILQAIHSFSPDAATSELLSGEKDVGVPFKDRVPRHQISSFTGDVSVSATLTASDEDIKQIEKKLVGQGFKIEDFPNEFVFERQQRFTSGDFERSYFSIRTPLKIKTGKQQKFRDPTAIEREKIRDAIYNFTPDIAFFPTFVFDFPDRIFLTNRGGKVNRFYKSVFQDVLNFEGNGYEINKDIVRRIRSDDKILPWVDFLSLWHSHDDQAKIDHVMDKAGVALTNLVFGKWNKIFGEDTKGKEITVSWEADEGKVKDESNTLVSTKEHDVYIRFQVKDGTRRFSVNDRSLGFRWFFAFMLFTQVRTVRTSSRPVLFLFDEPAANLHAAAQQRLIESFPEIAIDQHSLAYTTHSHYMIEPAWLEQTFIVTNRSDAPDNSVIGNVSLDDESLDITAETYRSFVNKNPSKTSYFQPILDRLQVVPSRFDLDRPSLVLEGKSDYYILRYATKLLKTPEIAMIPGLGAGTLSALVSLNTGWNLDFIFVLDADMQGKKEQARYKKTYALSDTVIFTLQDFLPEVKVIEDLLDDVARNAIAAQIAKEGKITKADIRRFFQERLANNDIQELSPKFKENSKKLLKKIQEKFTKT